MDEFPPEAPSDLRLTERIRSVLSELDWSTPARQIPAWSTHRRVYLAILPCCVASFVIWQILFPNTFWFLKLWLAGVLGGTIGIAVGYWWQLSCPERRAGSSGRFLAVGFLGWGLLLVVSCLDLVPELASQEAELATIRSLSNADIVEVRVAGDKFRPQMRADAAAIEQFRKLAHHAILNPAGPESPLERFEISIRLNDGTVLSYPGRVLEYHPDDLCIEFHGAVFADDEILFPGGRLWLDRLRH